MNDRSAHLRIDRLDEAYVRLLGHLGDINHRLDEYARGGLIEANKVALSMAIEQMSDVSEQLAAATRYAEFLRGDRFLVEENR